MAETLTIAGKSYPKSLVYGGAAVTAGIVGYAWFTKSGTTSDIPVEELPTDVVSDERIPATTIPTPSQFGTPLPDNDDWANDAIQKLSNIGIDAPMVASAIGKFLQRLPLTATEADLVRQAVGVAGYPPIGGPWAITSEPTPTNPQESPNARLGLPTPVFAQSMGSAQAYIQWSAVPGAKSYELRRQELNAGTITGWANIGNTTTKTIVARYQVPTAVAFQVRAVNDAGPGPEASSNHIQIQP